MLEFFAKQVPSGKAQYLVFGFNVPIHAVIINVTVVVISIVAVISIVVVINILLVLINVVLVIVVLIIIVSIFIIIVVFDFTATNWGPLSDTIFRGSPWCRQTCWRKSRAVPAAVIVVSVEAK